MDKPERGKKRQREVLKKHGNFKKRKECILKKTMELAVLCDLQACTVIIDDDGEIATWPENRDEVMKVLEKYRGDGGVRVPKINDSGEGERKEIVPVVTTTTTPMSDPLEWDQKVLEDLLNEPWEEILNEVGVGVGDGNNGGDFKNVDDYQSLLGEVDAKLKSLTERIEVLKSAEEYQSIYQQVPIAPPDVSYLFEGFLNQQSNFYIPDEVIVGAEMDSANFDSLMMETNEFMKSAEGYQSIQIPVAYFLEYNQDEGGSSSNSTQMAIDSPGMPYLFDQDLLNQQFCSTNWNLENCGDIF